MFSRVTIATTILLALYASAALAEKPVYGVIIDAPATPYWTAVELGLKDGAQGEQVEYYFQPVGTSEAAESPLTVCNNMLDRKPNVILVAAMDVSGLSPCVAKAENLNIPVIGLGDTSQSVQFENTGIASIVQTNHEETAAMSAGFIAETLGNDASGSVVVINDENQSTLELGVFTDQLHNAAPDLQVFTTTTPELATIATDPNATANPTANTTIRAIVLSDNTATLDAISSLPDSDRLIVSLDDRSDNSDLLIEGKIHAAVSRLPYLIGIRAMERASLAVNTSGNDINDVIYIPPILMTRETVEADSDPMLKFIR